ncbi:hypothetical protein A5706_02155 [Mycobacterium sp. E796]|nr:hypothetical protein A5706_02155 [Mycobacterium sp. E796]
MHQHGGLIVAESIVAGGVSFNDLLVVRGVTADEPHEAVAARNSGGETVGEINRGVWYRLVVRCPELLVDVREVAERGLTFGLPSTHPA